MSSPNKTDLKSHLIAFFEKNIGTRYTVQTIRNELERIHGYNIDGGNHTINPIIYKLHRQWPINGSKLVRIEQKHGLPFWSLELFLDSKADPILQYICKYMYTTLCQNFNIRLTKKEIFDDVKRNISNQEDEGDDPYRTHAMTMIETILDDPDKLWQYANAYLIDHCICTSEYLTCEPGYITLRHVSPKQIVIIDVTNTTDSTMFIHENRKDLLKFGWYIFNVLTAWSSHSLGSKDNIVGIIEALQSKCYNQNIDISTIIEDPVSVGAFVGALIGMYPKHKISIITSNETLIETINNSKVVNHINIGNDIELPHHIVTKNSKKDDFVNE
jgi:hypothetical protein